MNEILIRTREGADALLSAISQGTKEPERLAYFGVADVSAWSRLFGWRTIRAVSSPMMLPFLAGGSLRTGLQPVLLAGLAGGTVGELAKLRAPETTPIAGMCGVALNHAAYSFLLVDKGARPSRVGAGLRAATWLAGIGFAASRKKSLVAPVVIAGAVAATTSALAADPALREESVPAQGLAHGANLLLVSEGATLLRETVLIGDNTWCRLIDAGITTTAAIGHLLLVDGLTRE
ncbi:lysoplasmalogenase family protein [Corynebacterium alimapuense]|uniref:Lysoplasmalogenase n=1 Tax=Corynebacterium alimapuense TaxID=1576874 RepID=A0A3M8K802_9CORY|nr:lysoplasmalogenase family protein [Corynebacterium alimapuense]RNE48999.1 lysoplasmalogenase [Corynebacterium alimapuense]